ncbi:hypothetical protein RUM44_013050 [Polyplax serrata]|uniref:Alpha-MPP n=1 Tax=Polyplax serrata TaxID=468196 RepID=A0ABR1BD18_POLSC
MNNVGKHLFRKHRSRKALWGSWSTCKFSSNTKSTNGANATNVPVERPPSNLYQPSLAEPLPGIPKTVFTTAKEEHYKTQVTTLPNGLRVASEMKMGQFCTVGVVINSGCRYETSYISGISHFLEKLAFHSTSTFPNKDKILLELEKYGGICDCEASRDAFVYAASADIRGLDPVIKILGEVVLRPQLSKNEVDVARQTVQFELESLLMRPEQEPLLMDMIHAAAYNNNTLGLPKICPSENLELINRQTLFTYIKNHYTPMRMVVAGVGVEHERLLESVTKYFVDEKPIWVEDESLVSLDSKVLVDDSISQYTGGIVQKQCEIPLYAGPSGLPELAHIVVGFEGCSHKDPDFIAICVLNMIMGGGGSFSAGGPGKGMYTRLYTNVLNRFHWMYNATAYNHVYGDTGLFCVHASAPPQYVRDLVQVIIQEMLNMTGEINPSELRRAKTQLQSMLLMNLESRAVVFEDVARQVLATNHRKPPQYFIDAIEKITEDDVRKIAKRLVSSKPSVAARGDIRKLPTFEDIKTAVLDEEGRLPGGQGRLSLFR